MKKWVVVLSTWLFVKSWSLTQV